MDNHKKLQLTELAIKPTAPLLEQVLGDSYTAYEAFQDALPGLEIEQEWMWYTPYKAWFAKGQYRRTTARGTKKEKTLYWLHVFDDCFHVAVWFKEKNREAALQAGVSEETKQLICAANTMGKLPTFPVEFVVATTQPLADICTLIDCKKRIEG